jgi:hemoglobin
MKTFSTFAAACIAAITLLVNPVSSAQTAPAGDALYQELGGKTGIGKIVDDFLPIVLADARIKDSFKDADIERLGMLLAEQFCELSGGPCKYSGKDMKSVHKDMAIINAHFNALAEDLQIAMEKNNIPSRAQNRLIAKLAPMQRTVVTK